MAPIPGAARFETELRTVGAELAVVAAREDLDEASLCYYREGRVIVRLRREKSNVSFDFKLSEFALWHNAANQVQMILELAADSLPRRSEPSG